MHLEVIVVFVTSLVILSTRGYQCHIANLFKQKNPLAIYFQRVFLYIKKRPDNYQDILPETYFNRRNRVRCAPP